MVAVPEGLPLAVTIALAYSMNAMYDENIFVKVPLQGVHLCLQTAWAEDVKG